MAETDAGNWIPDDTEPYPEEDWWLANTESLEDFGFGLAGFDAAVDNVGAPFTSPGVFVSLTAQTFTPPASWGSYDIQVAAHAGMQVGSSQEVEAVVRIDGVDGPATTRDQNTTVPELAPGAVASNRTGSVSYFVRARNNDVGSGTVDFATYTVTAWRRS